MRVAGVRAHVELRLLLAGHFWPLEAPAETSAVLREVLAAGAGEPVEQAR
jgi:hypothetical protein